MILVSSSSIFENTDDTSYLSAMRHDTRLKWGLQNLHISKFQSVLILSSYFFCRMTRFCKLWVHNTYVCISRILCKYLQTSMRTSIRQSSLLRFDLMIYSCVSNCLWFRMTKFNHISKCLEIKRIIFFENLFCDVIRRFMCFEISLLSPPHSHPHSVRRHHDHYDLLRIFNSCFRNFTPDEIIYSKLVIGSSIRLCYKSTHIDISTSSLVLSAGRNQFALTCRSYNSTSSETERGHEVFYVMIVMVIRNWWL